ncbi:PREDICTED: serine-protein kinase ATM [Dinoponera quadriceps]|uniref:Serine/threonine-protein kinase ATM n=1 Tax=Dinoponera quadriceps TaxID=609295 RepID=A0A6P3X4B5_DINQU|nr:PREDICTED: serine-protein kinase ATM [Dinoponera quadriceps]
MSRMSEKIREILGYGDSKKVTEQKKCVSELLNLYQNNEALKEICHHTEQRSCRIINWCYIMHIAHKLALSEADRPGKESIKNNERQAVIRLIINTVRHSYEKSTELLKSNELIPLVLQILDSQLYIHYHDTYLGILVKYILPKNMDYSDITASQWRELLVVCKKLYKKMQPKKHIVLDALQMIVEYSFSHTNLLADVKDLPLFLENIFGDTKNTNDEQLIESFYKLANNVYRQIATESRITLCKFSETILMDMLHLNGSEEKYRFLLVILQIHHPEGISKCDDGAYAHDWNKWRDLLGSMYLLIQENCKLDVQWHGFVQFASEVVKQMLDNVGNVAVFPDANYGFPSAKRRRINKLTSIVDLITESNPEEAWPWIRITTETLKKYPQCLRSQDLAPLLQHLTELARPLSRITDLNESIMDNLYRFATVLMENEMSTGEVQDATIHWSKIWDMLLRSLGTNQNEESGHALARCFIKHNRMPNANAFLRLYLTRTIRWTPNNVRTLLLLCRRVSLPEDASASVLYPSPSSTPICDRTRLLEWLLSAAPWQKLARLPVVIDDICVLSVDLVLSSRCRQNIRSDLVSDLGDPKCLRNHEETRRVVSAPRDVYPTDLSRLCYSFLAFKAELLACTKDERVETAPGTITGPVPYVQETLGFLKQQLNDFLQEEGSNAEVYVVLTKLALLARLLSTLMQLAVLTEDCPLIDVLEKHLASSFQTLASISSKCKFSYLLNVIKALSALYGGAYGTSVAKIIVSTSTGNMLRNIFELLNVNDTDMADYQRGSEYYDDPSAFQQRRRSVGNAKTPSSAAAAPREGMIRLWVVEALTSFCALHVGMGDHPDALQIKIMKNFLLTWQDCANPVELGMSLTILESFAGHEQSEIHWKHADESLEFLLKVCRKPKDGVSVRRLLGLLPFFFEYAPRRIIETLSAFFMHARERNCGVSVHADYMRCICAVVRIDPGFSWSSDPSAEVTMMLDSVLDYIGHPSFVLRAQAVRCLQEFMSLGDVAYMWKKWMFIKVEETVLKLLEVDEQASSDSRSCLKTRQLEDERETKTATSLMALASVACISGVLQGRALSVMLELTVNREVKAQKVQKVLSAAMQQTMYTSLIEDNLNYLLTFWHDAGYPLQTFPWTLTGCGSVAEFFERHVNRIVPLLLRTSGLSKAVSFCDDAGVAFADVFEDIFPACFVWMISRVCNPASVDGVAVQTLKKLQGSTDEFASTRNLTRLLADQLKDVFVDLVQRLHDEKHFKLMFSFGSAVYFPEDDPPHFSAAMLDQCFGHLEQRYLMKPLTRLLVEEQPAVLQRTLLQLASAVHSSRSCERKLKRLHQYVYFCHKLTRNLGKPCFDKMAAFLVRDVCYSLLHFTGSDETLSAACCKFLDLFLRQALPTRAAEVRDVLRFVVANLIGLAQSASSAEVALGLLKFLIVEQREVLHESVAKLSSFPNLGIFREVREAHEGVRYADGAVCLEEELERFLEAISDENAECTLEDLVNLTQQLSTRKKELKELHRRLERPYPEGGVNILHQVIFKLMKLTESSNTRISMEATRCLGEFGPTDSTVVSQPSESPVREADHVIEVLTYRSVAMLTSFLAESAVDLRKVSADALYTMFSTTYGKKLSDPEYMKDLSNIYDKCAPLKLEYIRPFLHSRVVANKCFSVNFTRFRTIMEPRNSLWTIKNGESYAEWIIKVTCGVAECFADSYLDSFLPVCRLSVKFCELILPRIIFLIIERCENLINTLCDCINQFFRYHFAIDQEAGAARCDRNIVRRMLHVVNHVRTQLPDNVSLKLDYVYLARAAHECSAYYTALLFVQLACESFSTDYPNFSSDPKIDYIYEHQPQLGRVLQDIMQDTYLNISDPDAICGAGSSYLVDHNSRMQYYARTNSWDKVMLAQDIELSYGNPLAPKEMSNALHRSGLQFLQWQFLRGDLDEKFGYECAWRLGDWGLLVNDTATSYNNSTLESLENSFYQHHYHALKCFHEDDRRGTERALECARRSVISSLRVISLESSKTVNEKLSQLRLLREIEQLSGLTDSRTYPEVLQRWDEHEILNGQFEYVEPILQQRIIMFRIKESLKTDPNIQEAFFTTCLDLAMVAECQGNFPVAARALGVLAKHQDLSEDFQNQLLYQESLLAWMTRDQKIARRLLRDLIEKRNMKASLKAKALRVYGDWMAETKSENPQAVIQKYYLESIKSLETSDAIDERTPDVVKNLNDTQVALARFADAQYEQISDYMRSSAYESLKEYARSAVKVNTAQMNQDLKRAVVLSQRQSTNDEAELESIKRERRNYLSQAFKYYLRTLQSSEEHNLLIFRLVSLWLDNMFGEEVNEFLNELDTVPSFKFVPLVPQLAAHISNDLKNGFSAKIFDILLRCAREHPYHTLPVVLALKNLHTDNEFDSNIVTKKEERRVLGAKELLKRLAKLPQVSPIIYEMEILSRALVSLAYWQPKGNGQPGKRQQIPLDQPILGIKNLNNVLLPTLSLPVKPSCKYSDEVIGVKSYQNICEFVGGINAPKKIICVGTDGVLRRQLVKGKDDLRQDAVMQQVFTVINTLLRTCKETKRRNLRIRTYKVVPLTQRSGVLEWCDNTVPIAMVLLGNPNTPGLHKKYYPRDMSAEAAKNKLRNVEKESNEVKLNVFLKCCKHMRPAFQHFFEEKYLSPENWVERTLTYTRSVATTSIAGYILGLGDRHLSNILIDERTAEVVHIDFGIAFEQGKILPIRETIPFRLTRDIEVAMGASGIEGTMRRSCEVTMTMLRDQKQIIITLLQVLLYDPLFTWAITPEKACKMQSVVVKGFSERGRVPVETNKIAKRALLRIEQKLQGTEDGLVSSVSGQVERLLQEARDPANLCRVYYGWQPYL